MKKFNWLTGQMEDDGTPSLETQQPDLPSPMDPAAEGATPEDFMPAEQDDQLDDSNPILQKYSNTDEINNEVDDLSQRNVANEVAQSDAMQKPDAAPAAQPTLSRQKSLLEKLKALREQHNQQLLQAQEGASKNNMLVGMADAGNTIAQAFATGRGAKIEKPNMQHLYEEANRPVKDFEQQQANDANQLKQMSGELTFDKDSEMNDPDSDISKLYRIIEKQDALKRGASKEEVAALDKMTAAQLQKIHPRGFSTSSGNTRLVPKNIEQEDGTVHTVMIDAQSGKIVNDLGITGFAKRSVTDPVTGKRGIVSGASNKFTDLGDLKNTAKSQAVPEDGEPPKPLTVDEINKSSPVAYKQLESLKKEMIKDKNITNLRTMNSNVTNILTKLSALDPKKDIDANGNVIIDSGLREALAAQSASLSTGGNAKVAEGVIKEFPGSGGFLNKMDRWISGQEGTMTPADVDFFKKFALKMAKASQSSLKDQTQFYLDQVKQLPNLPRPIDDQNAVQLLSVDKLLPNAKMGKKVVKKGYNKKTNQTQLIYSDGSSEIVDGKQ